MKRFALLLAALLVAVSLSAQTPIDSPVATVKLVKTEVISVRQFNADVERFEKAVGRKLSAEERREYLNTKVNDLLFLQMCERDKIIATDGEIASATDRMRAQVGAGASDAQFEAALRAQGIQPAELRNYLRQQILLQKYIETYRKADLAKVKEPSADEIISTYELYKTQFIRPDTVRASVLFIDTRSMDAAGRAKAKATLIEMAAKVRENAARFDEYLVKSSDPAAGFKGTSSLYVVRTPQSLATWGQKFLDAAFALKAGQISEVIENEAGYQFVRVNEVFPQKQLALADPVQFGQAGTVQDYIRYQLHQATQQKLLQTILADLIASLRKSATVKIFEDALK